MRDRYTNHDLPVFRFVRFALAGGVCFLLNLVVLWTGTDILGFHYQVSVALAFVVVNLAGFHMNRRWAFRDKGDRLVSQIRRYYAVMLGSLLISILLMHVLVEWLGLHYLLANIAAAIILLFGNFSFHAIWTFQSRNNASGRDSD